MEVWGCCYTTSPLSLVSQLDHVIAVPRLYAKMRGNPVPKVTCCGSHILWCLILQSAAAPNPVMGAMVPNDAMGAPGFFQVWLPGASFVLTVEVGVSCRLEFGERAVDTVDMNMCAPCHC